MKTTTLQITYPTEKLDAIRQYMTKKEASLDAELQESLTRLYEKYVPRDVREFLEARESRQPEKPRRPRPAAVARTAIAEPERRQEAEGQAARVSTPG